MFSLYLTNFGYFIDEVFDTLGAVLEKAEQIHFECTIYEDGIIIGRWSPIGGFSPFELI